MTGFLAIAIREVGERIMVMDLRHGFSWLRSWMVRRVLRAGIRGEDAGY